MDSGSTDLGTFFSSITSNFSGSVIPAIMVGIAAIAVAVLIIIGAKVGFKNLTSFFKSGGK